MTEWWNQNETQAPKPCGTCYGSGETQEMGMTRCPQCAGMGCDTNSEFWAFPCPHCGTSGEVPYCRNVPCFSCGGSGIQ